MNKREYAEQVVWFMGLGYTLIARCKTGFNTKLPELKQQLISNQ